MAARGGPRTDPAILVAVQLALGVIWGDEAIVGGSSSVVAVNEEELEL